MLMDDIAKLTIEELGNMLYERREQIRELEAQKTAVQSEFETVEYIMIQKLQEAGLNSAGISRCTFSLKQEQYPQVKDMDAFARWAVEHDKTEMIQKRISSAVFKEYFAATNELPDGVDTYDKMTLSMRKR